MSSSRPLGTEWVHIPGKMSQIEIHKGQLVGINRGNAVFQQSVPGVTTSSITASGTGMYH